MSNRNETRWIAQETGEMDYDSKSMMHCFRLLEDAKSIAENGRPIVEFTGQRRDFLMDVRAGKYNIDIHFSIKNNKNSINFLLIKLIYTFLRKSNEFLLKNF